VLLTEEVKHLGDVPVGEIQTVTGGRNNQSVKSHVKSIKSQFQPHIGTAVRASFAYLPTIFLSSNSVLINLYFLLLSHLGKFFYQSATLKSMAFSFFVSVGLTFGFISS
jgi:hypothetical protein